MENRLDTDILTAENQPRNWLHTIERRNLPFVAVNPLTADTESFAEGVAKRQAILRGSVKLGQSMQRLGSGMVAYGSTTHTSSRTSHVMRRGSSGERQNFKFTHEGLKHDKPAPTRTNRWLGYETKHDSKAGTKAPSSRTVQRSSSLVNIGTLVYVAGRWIPVLGAGYAIYDTFGDGSEPHQQFASDVDRQITLNQDAMRNTIHFGKSFYSSPIGKIATTVALSKLGLF